MLYRLITVASQCCAQHLLLDSTADAMFFAGIASALNLSQTNMLQCNDTMHTVALLVDLTKQGAVIKHDAHAVDSAANQDADLCPDVQLLLAVKQCCTAQQALYVGVKVHNSTTTINLQPP